MNIIKSFELDEDQLKEALEQWLNTCVLKVPCEIARFEVKGYGERTVEITLKEKAKVEEYPSLPTPIWADSDLPPVENVEPL